MSRTYPPFSKSFAITKVSEATHETYGIVTAEVEDADGEICDYTAQRPYYQEWANGQLAATTAAGQTPSMGNVRWQHTLEIAGKVTAINFADDKKEIWLHTQPIAEKWPLIRDGFITGLSQAGTYVRRWCAHCGSDIARGNECPRCVKTVPVRYCAKLSEVSYVDRPAVPIATFQYVKVSGQTEMRKANNSAWEWYDRDVFEEQILIPRIVFDDDSTGFEIFQPTLSVESCIRSVPVIGVMHMAGFDAADDSTGFE